MMVAKNKVDRSRLSVARKNLLKAERAFYKVYDEVVRCEGNHPYVSTLHDFVELNPHFYEMDLSPLNIGPLTKEWLDFMIILHFLAKDMKRAEIEYNLASGAVIESIDDALKV